MQVQESNLDSKNKFDVKNAFLHEELEENFILRSDQDIEIIWKLKPYESQLKQSLRA